MGPKYALLWVSSGFVCSFLGGPTCVVPSRLQMSQNGVWSMAQHCMFQRTHVGIISEPIWAHIGIKLDTEWGQTGQLVSDPLRPHQFDLKRDQTVL